MFTATDLQIEISLLESLLLVKKRQLNRLYAVEHGFTWEEVSDRILILHDPTDRNGWQSCTYLGFVTKKDAEKCLSFIRKQEAAGSIEGPRPAERIAGYKWELKCCDLKRETAELFHRKQTAVITLVAA